VSDKELTLCMRHADEESEAEGRTPQMEREPRKKTRRPSLTALLGVRIAFWCLATNAVYTASHVRRSKAKQSDKNRETTVSRNLDSSLCSFMPRAVHTVLTLAQRRDTAQKGKRWKNCYFSPKGKTITVFLCIV
jgi:hypothetical protein